MFEAVTESYEQDLVNALGQVFESDSDDFITEAWQASLQLFHERFLPGVGVERTEIEGEGHVSPIVGTVGEGADGSSPAKGVPGLLESQYAIVRRRRLDPSRRPASLCAAGASPPSARVCVRACR